MPDNDTYLSRSGNNEIQADKSLENFKQRLQEIPYTNNDAEYQLKLQEEQENFDQVNKLLSVVESDKGYNVSNVIHQNLSSNLEEIFYKNTSKSLPIDEIKSAIGEVFGATSRGTSRIINEISKNFQNEQQKLKTASGQYEKQ